MRDKKRSSTILEKSLFLDRMSSSTDDYNLKKKKATGAQKRFTSLFANNS